MSSAVLASGATSVDTFETLWIMLKSFPRQAQMGAAPSQPSCDRAFWEERQARHNALRGSRWLLTDHFFVHQALSRTAFPWPLELRGGHVNRWGDKMWAEVLCPTREEASRAGVRFATSLVPVSATKDMVMELLPAWVPE